MLLGALAVSEKPGALEGQFDTLVTVREIARILFGRDMDALAVHDNVVALDGNVTRELAVDAVMLEQPGIGLRVGEVVDADQLEPAIRTFEDRSGDQAAD